MVNYRLVHELEKEKKYGLRRRRSTEDVHVILEAEAQETFREKQVEIPPRSKHNKKNEYILFFVRFGTHNYKIHTIYKQTSVFAVIFSMLMFCFY
jgi:hypothetical protein